MGYHLTILRSANAKQLPISLEEAKAAAHDLGWEYGDRPPTLSRMLVQGSCTLRLQRGELWAKNPEPWEIEAMIVLAKQLDARVRGDEFETYESVDKTYPHPDDVQLRKEAEAKSKALLADSRREQRLIRNVIIGFFVVLGAIAYVVGTLFEK